MREIVTKRLARPAQPKRRFLLLTLNIITITIMVPTFVASIFSMNVELPFGLKEHPAFWLIMGLGAVSMVGFLIFWKYKKW